nr:MAG TPA: hypothetical protein [Caudoviricetes sp.]
MFHCHTSLFSVLPFYCKRFSQKVPIRSISSSVYF